MASTYVVTGATGYIGSHVIKMLLDRGNMVRGTVRSLSSRKAEFLRALPGASERLDLIEVDLLSSEDLWCEVVHGCKTVFHIAATLAQDGTQEEEIRTAALQGTSTVLKACIRENIPRVVLTSSTGAIIGGYPTSTTADVYTSNEVCPLTVSPGVDETFWSKTDALGQTPAEWYWKAKTEAERMAWELVKGTPVELATVNPSFVLGPILSAEHATGSIASIVAMLQGKLQSLPIPYGIVDVRDVAKLHLLCADSPQASGRRHMACATPINPMMSDVAGLLADRYNDKGAKVSTQVMTPTTMEALSKGNHFLRIMRKRAGKTYYYNPVNGTNLIGEWIPWQQTVCDTAESVQDIIGPPSRSRL